MKKQNLIIFLMIFLVSFCLLNSATLDIENMNEKQSIINKSQNDNEDYFNHDSRTIYDNKKYDIEYHIPTDEIENSSASGSWLLNKGRVEFYPWAKMTNLYTYNEKNYYKYGTAQYVPTYEDSIYLSSKNRL
jgi:hypothetical protein